MFKKAFTYVELLVALSLFTVGMVSVLEIFPVTRRFITQSSMTTQATFLVQEQLEDIRSVDYGNLTVGTAPYYEPLHSLGTGDGDPINLFSRRTEVSYVDPSTFADSVTDQNMKKVVVLVYWEENNITRNIEVSSYIYNK